MSNAKENTMKRILLCALVLLVAAGGRVVTMQNRGDEKTETTAPQSETGQSVLSPENEIRAVWVNYNELSMKAQNGGTKAQFTEKAKKITTDIASAGLNTVIVH